MKTIKALCTVLARRMLVGIVAVIIVMKTLPVHASTTIEHLQLMLNELGFDAGSPDGISGPRTEAALAAFAAQVGLDPARVDIEFLETIYDRYRAETENTVFDIYNAEPHGFDADITQFPETPYGDISLLRSAIVEDRLSYAFNYCDQVDRQLRVLEDIGTLIGFEARKGNGWSEWRTIAEDTENWPAEGGDGRAKYNGFVQTLAMDLLLKGNHSSAERLAETLLRYARADAFTWVNGSSQYSVTSDDTYSLKAVFGPTLASWSVLSRVENPLSTAEIREIDLWIWRVINRVDHVHGNDPSLPSNRNNQRYMLAVILMQAGFIYESEYFVHRALFEASRVGDEMREDGSLPLEMRRGFRAQHYTGHAASSLVALAEFASIFDYDLYEHEAVRVREMMEFFSRSLSDPEIIERYAGTKQSQLSSWRIRSMPLYCTRYPEAENCDGFGYTVDGVQMFPRLDLAFDLDGLVNQCVNALMWSAEVRSKR